MGMELISNVIAKDLGYETNREAKKKVSDFDLQVALYAIENATKVFRTASVSGGAYLKRKETIIKSKSEKRKLFVIQMMIWITNLLVEKEFFFISTD